MCSQQKQAIKGKSSVADIDAILFRIVLKQATVAVLLFFHLHENLISHRQQHFYLKVCFNALNHNFQYNVRSPFCKTCPAKLCTLWLHCVVAASTAETSTADKYYKMITGWKKKRKK